MGDVGDFWRDVRDARRAKGLPARPSRPKPRAVQPRRDELLAFVAAGFEQRSQWHWQRRIGDLLLDYWPSKAKWRFRDQNHVGTWKELLVFVEKEARGDTSARVPSDRNYYRP